MIHGMDTGFLVSAETPGAPRPHRGPRHALAVARRWRPRSSGPAGSGRVYPRCHGFTPPQGACGDKQSAANCPKLVDGEAG